MRELFEDVNAPAAMDPHESARQGARPTLHRRFYTDVSIDPSDDGFAVLLDSKPVKTPARRALAAPHSDIAAAMAAEWRAQKEMIEPSTMPLTRLANSIIDGVADRRDDVVADIAKYFESDLLFYRAEHPVELVDRQAAMWDPVVRWAADEFGARFVLAQGIVHARQPDHAIDAAKAALPRDPWQVGALHLAVTLTGSALLALALQHGFRDADTVWQAAHVDEDWNREHWGTDPTVMAARARRFADLQAAALVLRAGARPAH